MNQKNCTAIVITKTNKNYFKLYMEINPGGNHLVDFRLNNDKISDG